MCYSDNRKRRKKTKTYLIAMSLKTVCNEIHTLLFTNWGKCKNYDLSIAKVQSPISTANCVFHDNYETLYDVRSHSCLSSDQSIKH